MHFGPDELIWSRRKRINGKGPSARRDHTATAIKIADEDLILIIGGLYNQRALGDVHLFQCSSSSWVQKVCAYTLSPSSVSYLLQALNGETLGPRSGHTATLVGSAIYVVGGKNDNGISYPGVSILDTVNWKWRTVSTTGDAPPGLCGHTTTAVGRRLFVVGGRRSDGEPSRRIYILNTGTIHAWPSRCCWFYSS